MDAKDRILNNWKENGTAWIQTIQANEIASRPKVTNAAILEAVLALHPKRVLDLGCGEGWLCRALLENGIEAVGIDGVPELIEHANQKGGTFYELPYRDCTPDRLPFLGTFDVLIFNYSLFEKEVTDLLTNLRTTCLRTGGKMLFQTVHPEHPALGPEGGSRFIREDWHMMQRDYSGTYSWYLRTRSDWEATIADAGLSSVSFRETHDPESGEVVSLVVTGSVV
jgi:SAM-dependent methyltransferase